MPKIDIDDLASTIANELNNYSREIRHDMADIRKEVAKDTQKVLKKTSPVQDVKGGGDYAKSWRVDDEPSFGGEKKYIVHSKKEYPLTHLLEHGHALVGGGRARAFPHIGPAEEMAIEEYMARVEKRIKDGGR